MLAAVALTVGLAASSAQAWAQSADGLAKEYTREAMEQALETRQTYDLYGLHFESDQAAIQADRGRSSTISRRRSELPEWGLGSWVIPMHRRGQAKRRPSL
jgi:hypothetical protein